MDRELRAYFQVLYNQGQRIERALSTEGRILMGLNEELAELKADADTENAKLDKLIAAFENAGTLTQDQQDAFDALKAELTGGSAAIDAANPPVVTDPGTPVDSAPDAGSTADGTTDGDVSDAPVAL